MPSSRATTAPQKTKNSVFYKLYPSVPPPFCPIGRSLVLHVRTVHPTIVQTQSFLAMLPPCVRGIWGTRGHMVEHASPPGQVPHTHTRG
jgi:hypothetical protein